MAMQSIEQTEPTSEWLLEQKRAELRKVEATIHDLLHENDPRTYHFAANRRLAAWGAEHESAIKEWEKKLDRARSDVRQLQTEVTALERRVLREQARAAQKDLERRMGEASSALPKLEEDARIANEACAQARAKHVELADEYDALLIASLDDASLLKKLAAKKGERDIAADLLGAHEERAAKANLALAKAQKLVANLTT